MPLIEWAEPPADDDASIATKRETAEALAKRPGKFAIVGRHDRATRAMAHAQRINLNREYGTGYAAVVRRIGNQHLVYARYDR